MDDKLRDLVDASVGERLRAWRRNTAMGFAVLLAGIGLNLYLAEMYNKDARDAIVSSGRIVSVTSCNRDFESLTSFRNLFQRLIDMQDRELKSGNITQSEYSKAIQFYGSEKAKVRIPDCRKSRKIVTDNPSDISAAPAPKFTGSGG